MEPSAFTFNQVIDKPIYIVYERVDKNQKFDFTEIHAHQNLN